MDLAIAGLFYKSAKIKTATCRHIVRIMIIYKEGEKSTYVQILILTRSNKNHTKRNRRGASKL